MRENSSRNLAIKMYHSYNLRVHSLCDNASAGRDVVDNFVECGSLDLLAFEICHRVHKIEPDATLPQLTNEKFFLL